MQKMKLWGKASKIGAAFNTFEHTKGWDPSISDSTNEGCSESQSERWINQKAKLKDIWFNLQKQEFGIASLFDEKFYFRKNA